jgi:hypothetical protein
MCSPTIVTNVTRVASVTKVWVFVATTEVTRDFLVTTFIIVTSNINIL